MIPLDTIDKSWTLFLDRDGVINQEKENGYINSWNEFIFYDGVLESFRIFKKYFKRIVVITNQRGVEKGLTHPNDLELIHFNLKQVVVKEGGLIDAIYFCSALEDRHPDRKPNIGMGLRALEDFPDIQVAKSIMVGNSLSDMSFGRNLGVYTVFLSTTNKDVNADDDRIDITYDSLVSFARALNADKF